MKRKRRITAKPDPRSNAADAIKGRPWELCAYRVQEPSPELVPAAVRREWMQDTFEHFATRCLPMMIANQSGWFILNSHGVRLTWNGGPKASDLRVEYANEVPADPPIASHFGHGIATWRIPILFRTPANFNLWVRGPANTPKLGVYALEGVVETDWSTATFTMNWKLLNPDQSVTFEVGEPICMISPQRKSDLEQFSAVSRPVSFPKRLTVLS
ncbi:MAG: DUF6065 family protein [Gemmatimonadota bacterium]